MGVYIKGMEMPTTCLSCDFHKCAGGVGDYCTLTKKKQFRFKNRPSYCPLVPVPPHGRLIDGDVAEAICFTNEDADGKDFYDGILYAADFISQQPTIIEAEEGE